MYLLLILCFSKNILVLFVGKIHLTISRQVEIKIFFLYNFVLSCNLLPIPIMPNLLMALRGRSIVYLLVEVENSLLSLLEMELKWEEGYDRFLPKPEMVLKGEGHYSIHSFVMQQS